jgi:hypothetical protein
MRKGIKQPRFSKGQKVRCWVGDEFVVGVITAIGKVATGLDKLQYDVRFYENRKGIGLMWEHDMEAEDAVSRLGDIV